MRNPRLDLLRFVAIALVLGSHLLGLGLTVSGPAGAFLRVWERVGWIGVDLFFVLSGFLVANLLLEDHSATGRIRLGRFLLRRGLKIYPAFYFFTAVATVLLVAEGQFSWPRLASEVFFVQNYFVGKWILPPGQTTVIPGQPAAGFVDQAQWSLAIEEHFYLLLGFTLLWMARKRRLDNFPLVCLGVAVTSQLLRIQYCLHHTVSIFGPSSTYTQFRIDSLFFGAFLAYLMHQDKEAFRRESARYRLGLLALGVVGLVPFFVLSDNYAELLTTFGFTILYVSCGCLLVALLDAPTPPLLGRACRPLAFLGRYSYGIYLWHLFVRYAMWRWGERLWGPDPSPWPQIGVYLGGSILLGVVMSFLVEVPFLKLRERWVP